MNGKELVSAIYERLDGGVYKKDIDMITHAYRDVVATELGSGNTVSLQGFMTLEPVDIPERTVRNPKTNVYSTQTAHRKVRVRMSEKLINEINGR